MSIYLSFKKSKYDIKIWHNFQEMYFTENELWVNNNKVPIDFVLGSNKGIFHELKQFHSQLLFFVPFNRWGNWSYRELSILNYDHILAALG